MCEKMIETLLQHGLIVNPRDVDNPCLLNTAVEKSYLKVVKDLLEYGAAVNMLTTSRFGGRCTPLHSAVYGKQVEMAKLLINYGANVNIKNAEGKAPLVCAIQTRNTEMIELLLINGADTERDPEVLCTAAEYGCFKLVEGLLKDGFDVNKFTSKFLGCYMPLHTAVLAKQSEMVQLLIKNGANVNIKDAKGITPLVCAIQTMNTKMIELLVINGADIKEDPTLLCIAIKSSSPNIVEGPFKNGADVNRSPGSSCFAVIPNAMHGKQVEVAKLLINYGAKVNITDAEGITPLVCAIKTRNTKLIELLLINGAGIKGDPKVLCTAVEYECLKIVEELLKDGADVNMLTTSGFGRCITLLHGAICREQVEMAKLLINYGANVNIKKAEGKSPLVCAIQTRNTEMIELLLINGADIKGDPNLLHTAVEYKCLKIVEELLKDGADVNMLTTSKFGKCCTLLHSAVHEEQVEMAKLLIKYGANVNIKDAEGITPLVCAIKKRYTEMIELLLINGDDEVPKVLCIAAEYGCFKLVEDLLKDGADVNMLITSRYGEYWTPLHSAVRGKQVKMAELLINYGANVNIKDAEGITPLVCAIKTRYTEMIELLLINGGYEFPKVLCIAAEYGCFKLVDDLLKDGADVNMLNTSRFGEYWTPLHSAVRGKQLEMAKLLIKYGANVNIKDAEGITPLVCAIKKRYTEMIELLLINGADIKVDLQLQYRNSEIINLVTWHIAKAKAAGLHLIVNEINLLWLKDHEIKNFLNLCETEIEIMKSKMIGNSCSSFYDILINDTSQLARNESIVQALNYDDYKTKFPIYASMIDSRFRRLVERRVLLKQVRNKCLHSFFKSLPVLCTEKIFSYLSDRDLRILLAA